MAYKKEEDVNYRNIGDQKVLGINRIIEAFILKQMFSGSHDDDLEKTLRRP